MLLMTTVDWKRLKRMQNTRKAVRLQTLGQHAMCGYGMDIYVYRQSLDKSMQFRKSFQPYKYMCTCNKTAGALPMNAKIFLSMHTCTLAYIHLEQKFAHAYNRQCHR